MRYVISLLFSGSVYFLQNFTDRTDLKVDGESPNPLHPLYHYFFQDSIFFTKLYIQDWPYGG